MDYLPTFLPGLELAEAFFFEAVEPALLKGFPALRYSAGLLGSGSEVLGFDTPLSTDHHWGPRVMVFLREQDLVQQALIEAFLGTVLPPLFRGWSTHWGPPDAIGVRLLRPAILCQPIAHRVETMNFQAYLTDYLGSDPTPQKLRTLRYGRIFRDDLGVKALLEPFAFYPQQIWIGKMAELWDAIAEEEPFIGRCADVGDERGSRIVATRLVDHAIHLAFLQEREYAPYSKWLGTAFERLAVGPVLGPLVDRVLQASEWRGREQAFLAVGRVLAHQHNRLGLTPPLSEEPTPFWGRPYRVIHGDRFAQALRQILPGG